MLCRANHISNWDPVLVAIAVKRPVHFMAKVQLFRIPVLGKLLRALGAFPVDRDAADIGAIKTALTHLKHDEPLGIFPQGKRMRGEVPQTKDIKSGVGMMVYRTEAPVVPIAIYTKDYKVRLFRRYMYTSASRSPLKNMRPVPKALRNTSVSATLSSTVSVCLTRASIL